MKNQAIPPNNAQSGSIFVWIFIMIALFGALSWAMSRGSRTGTSMVSDEQARLIAQEIIQYGTQVKETVRALQINGCKDTEISFEDGPTEGNYTNPTAPSDKHCHVYDTQGGNLRATKLGDDWGAERLFFGSNIVKSRDDTKNFGTAEPDLTMVRQVSRQMCGTINKLLGNPTEYWLSPTNEKHMMWESEGDHAGARQAIGNESWYTLYPFQGDYTQPYAMHITINDNSLFNGQSMNAVLPPPAGCFCESDDECDVASNPTYYFYNVLIPR